MLFSEIFIVSPPNQSIQALHIFKRFDSIYEIDVHYMEELMNCLKSNNRLRILTIYPRTQSCANMISIDTKFFDLLNEQRGLLFFFAAGINIEVFDCFFLQECLENQ